MAATTHTCTECRSPFTARPQALTCSPRCRQARWRRIRATRGALPIDWHEALAGWEDRNARGARP